MKASHAIVSTTHRSISRLRSTGHSEQCKHVQQGNPRTFMTLTNFEFLYCSKIYSTTWNNTAF